MVEVARFVDNRLKPQLKPQSLEPLSDTALDKAMAGRPRLRNLFRDGYIGDPIGTATLAASAQVRSPGS